MKVLQLSPQFPFPADDGGKISIANIYNNLLDSGVEVEMVCISNFEIEKSIIEKYKNKGNIHIIRKDTRNTKLRILKYFFAKKSIYIEKHFSVQIVTEIEQLIDFNSIDIIHCDHSNMAKIGYSLSKTFNKPFGIRLHNVEYMIWQRYYENLKGFSLKKIFINQQAKLLKEEERKFIQKADVSFAISYKDRERALELAPKANIINASAGVDLDIWTVDDTVKKKENSLVIATTFNWVHNVNALKWFIENVQSVLVKIFPNIKLSIIGKNAPTYFDKFRDIGVSKLGYVDDVRPYLNSSQIYIAPLFVGSGIRIKILEAMAMKLPVVATDVSAEGIEANEEQGLFRVNSKVEFLEIIDKLFRDQNLRIELGEKARDFIKKKHSWKSNVNLMKNEYIRLVSSMKKKA